VKINHEAHEGHEEFVAVRAADRRRFHVLVQQAPHFATHVMKVLADRLRRMNALMAVR
jgi:hypothetical protein